LFLEVTEFFFLSANPVQLQSLFQRSEQYSAPARCEHGFESGLASGTRKIDVGQLANLTLRLGLLELPYHVIDGSWMLRLGDVTLDGTSLIPGFIFQ
jgi:hypothetical protein